MDIERMRRLAAEYTAKLEAMRAFDTLDNERRLISLLATRGIKTKVARKKSPERYTVIMPDGSSIGRGSLLDLNDIAAKLGLV